MRNPCLCARSWTIAALLLLAQTLVSAAQTADSSSMWLSALDLHKIQQDWGAAQADRSVEGHPLSIAGKHFDHGVGSHAASMFCIDVGGEGNRFTASVGIDDEAGRKSDPVQFQLVGDGKMLWQSKPLSAGIPAEDVDVDLTGVKALTLLIVPVGDGNQFCHADWADAKIAFSGRAPVGVDCPKPPSHVLTPSPPAEPRINGPAVFGVRPGHPFLYTIPATGDRPITFAVDDLPAGLSVDPATGQITGALPNAGEFPVTFRATNTKGAAKLKFRIVVGEEITLTPPMGWNSWNCWGGNVDQNKILRSARAMAASGLINHGWTYINIDDAWQGARGAEFNAIQPNPRRFPDIKAMCDEIHHLGLKVGIYSTPWVTSYAGRVGGSSENPQGAWDKTLVTNGPRNCKVLPYAIGHYHFFTNDARQWAAWRIDYLKFDWGPNEVPETKEMADALRGSERDIVLSLSNNSANTLFGVIPEISPLANCWRIGDDIGDSWNSIVSHGFRDDKWAPYARPGHWNDPDMFEVGANGGGGRKRLKPDEQYTHVSLWCLLSAPLLLGCDMDHLDDFTLNLLTNDEVLAVDQDPLGRQGVTVAGNDSFRVIAKPMADGSTAVGLFNLGKTSASCTANWTDLKITAAQVVRDLWRQKDLGQYDHQFETIVPAHGVAMVRLRPVGSGQ